MGWPIITEAVREALNKRRANDETDDMTDEERKLRGVASQGKKKDEDEDADDKKVKAAMEDGDTHAVVVDGKLHSTHASKEDAMDAAQDLDGGEVSVHRLRKEDDEDADDKKSKRSSKKSIFRSVIFGGGDQSKTQDYPIEDQPSRGPRVHDEGEDIMGRVYADGVMDRIAGAFSRKQGGDPDAIPNAGAGETWNGDTRSIDYRPQAFTQGDGRVGQERRRGPFAPNLGAGTGSYIDREGMEPDDTKRPESSARLGDMRVMLPSNSGIAPAAGAQFPDAATSVRKRRVGLFKAAIFGRKNDQADSFLSEE